VTLVRAFPPVAGIFLPFGRLGPDWEVVAKQHLTLSLPAGASRGKDRRNPPVRLRKSKIALIMFVCYANQAG
jgi:hypothetical protein